MQKLFSLVFLYMTFAVNAQMPNTELWLFKMDVNKLKQSVLTNSLNITKREGYDNQPSFSKDGKKIYYVSVRNDNQADIFYYDLKSKKTTQLTKSLQSEYSPVMTADEKFLTSVVVESDSSQRIHFIDPVKGRDSLSLEMDSVGYYTFLNADTIVYYKLTNPHSLRVYSKSSREDKWLGSSPVRAFKPIDRHTLLYGLKDSVKVIFYKYDFLLRKAEKYTEYLSLNEDFIWHPTYGLVKSEGPKLLRFDEKKQEWLLLFDLSSIGIKKITRFDFDPKNKYLVVADNL